MPALVAVMVSIGTFIWRSIRNLGSYPWRSSVGMLDKAIIKLRREGTAMEVVGINEPGIALISRYAVHNKPASQETH